MTPKWRYRCQKCGEVLVSWAAAQRHADSHGGGRIDLMLKEQS
jgi:hypothetical protein